MKVAVETPYAFFSSLLLELLHHTIAYPHLLELSLYLLQLFANITFTAFLPLTLQAKIAIRGNKLTVFNGHIAINIWTSSATAGFLKSRRKLLHLGLMKIRRRFWQYAF
ncbi:hypothetical protein PHYBLDRAFT_158948 [Phycomyces blakesleeanus NRRL 1555(-)]|uniref:Uncharacterized protein n=1 Tax=Phycomyces blakesleeanus (strain ATCC 8743b / DSM 1359 / FGSC 10004 / NBRC 33097 / NRRL 1555) TaxID=763407 RepID=A0A162XA98_PHYB8|nr:hypothetical protein PHYBLDRAFT_158948 [Phycomyces blakesleeanus NRRL 1555(-)]OAD73495.1 hypothetical protein PHYBLDRAFT_158948 [Phycomyces blakesleeanus NRRL 1555(-)]|eukprot:XP_018291535.1 hypothetical protein PHYBLDRAFT_158948 [Phycomyces blakesleeanus NRRL 1555(-)]